MLVWLGPLESCVMKAYVLMICSKPFGKYSPDGPQIHTRKLLDLLTNVITVLRFVQFNMMIWGIWSTVFTRTLECVHIAACKRLWADLWSKARLRQRDLIQKQTMDHCSSHNKHLACDTAHRPRSSAGSERPLLREQDRTGCSTKMRSQSRKTPPWVQTYGHADKGRFRICLTEPAGTRRGTGIINAATKAIQNRHLMASNFNMRHI